jgi:hypothetical protein
MIQQNHPLLDQIIYRVCGLIDYNFATNNPYAATAHRYSDSSYRGLMLDHRYHCLLQKVFPVVHHCPYRYSFNQRQKSYETSVLHMYHAFA